MARRKRPKENNLTFVFPKGDVFISENIGRFREWEMGSRMFWDDWAPPLRSGDAKLPKYVWRKYGDTIKF